MPSPVMSVVLVVDDDPSLLRVLRLTLQGHGFEVETATEGRVALRAATQPRLALVVLDLGLPDADGVSVVKEFRRRSAVPILVISARHGSEDKSAAMTAGANDYLTKPFALEELLTRVAALVSTPSK